MNISRTASAFLKGVYFMREHAMAQDAKDTPEGTRWVTIGHTEEHKGQHVLINKKDGRIEGGLGGKFNGTKLKDLGKAEKKASAAGKAQKKSMDYSLPKKVNPEFIQNRDREGGASQEQILSISAKPDYLRLSTSNMLADGAPVVAYGKIPAKQLRKLKVRLKRWPRLCLQKPRANSMSRCLQSWSLYPQQPSYARRWPDLTNKEKV